MDTDSLRQSIFGDSDEEGDEGLFQPSDDDLFDEEPEAPVASSSKRLKKKRDSAEEEDYEPSKGKKKGEKKSKPRKRKRDDDGGDEEPKKRRKKSEPKKKKKPAPEVEEGSFSEEEDNSLEAMLRRDARMRSQRRKKSTISSDVAQEHVKEFLGLMENAVNQDLEAYQNRKPATKKLALLPRVVDELHKAALIDEYLAQGVLSLLKAWLDPLPNGSIPNIKIRTSILEILDQLTEAGLAIDDLKQSGIGKAVALSLRHPDETLKNKKIARRLVDMWTRSLFSVNDHYDEDGGVLEEELSKRRRQQEAERARQKGTSKESPFAYGRIPKPASMDYVRMPQNEVQPRQAEMENEAQRRLRARLNSLGRKRNERAITVGITKHVHMQ